MLKKYANHLQKLFELRENNCSFKKNSVRNFLLTGVYSSTDLRVPEVKIQS